MIPPTTRTLDLSSLNREELEVLRKLVEYSVENEQRHPTGQHPLPADLSVLGPDEMRIFGQIVLKLRANEFPAFDDWQQKHLQTIQAMKSLDAIKRAYYAERN